MKKTNPSTLYSKSSITNSMLAYMKYRSFSDIKITEIVKKAGISRKTFYRHFTSKEDILIELLDRIYNEYVTSSIYSTDYQQTIKIFFKTMKKHHQFFQLIYLHDLSFIAIKRLEKYLSLLNENPKHRCMDKPMLAYCEVFSAAGLWKISRKWITDGLKESVEEITYIYLKLTK